ncbi:MULTISPECIES: branched-chain amino acid ABC transporter permease [unclassified Polaromonas]|jgi:branched-chain amino acid transport system permease protein|uniref:branched-chain amino acid ABC transporter permease n=1 Tax=unclassified Polaromonas TaxID=2638319 RepID=UPI000BDC72DA|nr:MULTISPECIES: branched-chain amino acid ABC transporter permease [unclassified Polaromonas]OYY33018.1 MAG: branched-chain amino acid ABC transporter permease [Polaromonas sp. 35-63-35]OYZ17197.1 MAG: branched-chain amino acid ABC transporter permease [Polaromonas sp. 16-63-31]OYZ76451.1 MAG: branched-chain amino acid ABC transporter permease [Polaromonas sp. 24-63-21]OZA47607.1 MAG: branched-chain amino acid ABC transporter permease [Polaromonas sp. 17-63-33]OZA85686.1 MAG: branched-chain a
MSILFDIMSTAGILFIVSCGLLLIFGVMKIINFAHGGFLTLGGYAPLLITQMGWNPWLGALLAFAMGLVFGAVVERLVVKPLHARPLDAILATWGLGIIIGQVITLIFGRGVQFVQSPLEGTVNLFGTDYSFYRLALVALACLMAAGIGAVLNGTRLGLITRAVTMNESLARALGVNSAWVRLSSFAIGAGLACLAGALITPLSSVDPNMGVPWLTNAFMLAMISGTSLASLALSSVVLGAAQVLISVHVSPILGSLTIVVLGAVALRIRPEGFARG